MIVCVQTSQARQSNRRGLRPVVSTFRIEANMMVVYANELGKSYVGRASDLVKRLRQAGLRDTGIKAVKCQRLASYLIKNNLPITS